IFVENARAFVLADLLDEDLLRGLGGDAAEFAVVNQRLTLADFDLAGHAVDGAGDIIGLAIEFPRGRQQCRLDIDKNRLLVDVLVRGGGFDDSQNFLFHWFSCKVLFGWRRDYPAVRLTARRAAERFFRGLDFNWPAAGPGATSPGTVQKQQRWRKTPP